MIVYALSTCDTCRTALKALRAAGHDPEVVDVRKDGVPPEALAALLDTFGAALVNRKSATWRGLTEAERAGDPAALLAAHPTLMKRPAIRDGDAWYLGWGPDVRAALVE